MSDDAASNTPVQPRRRRWLRWTLLSCAGVCVMLALGIATLVASRGPLRFDEARAVSTTVLDRNGRLLRAYAMDNGRWRLPVKASSKDIDPRYVDLLLGFEDKRFREHRGVDPLALGRAAIQLMTHGRIVSGGSTITMQLARLMEPRRERSLIVKLRQIVRAIELERHLSKDEILDLYFTLAPFGGNLEGVRAASLAYFGNEPKRLTLGESALLVALPQSPETRRLDRFADRARIARDRVLDRMVAEGRVTREDAERAKAEAVPSARQPMPLLAPHATDRWLQDRPTARRSRPRSTPHCSVHWKIWRGTARRCWAAIFPSASLRSTTPAATSSPISARPITSMCAAQGRSI
jgi:penicillin-binding protein 1C